MKSILKYILFYIIILVLVGGFFNNLEQENQNKLDLVHKEESGEEYINILYNLSLNIISYIHHNINNVKNSVRKSKNLILKDVEKLKKLQQQHPQFKNTQFITQLESLLERPFDARAYFEFLDYLNHENYAIGDRSNLLFESDRKTHFLAALLTHYMPEYILSILTVQTLLEQYMIDDGLSTNDMAHLVEHTKLVTLSVAEINSIISSLGIYEDTQVLIPIIHTINNRVEALSSVDILNVPSMSYEGFQAYQEEMQLILQEAYKLNDAYIAILEKTLKKDAKEIKEKTIEYRLFFLFISIILLLMLTYIFYVAKQNKKHQEEIERNNEVFDRFVIASRTDISGKITYVSRAFELLSGYSAEELLGKNHRLLKVSTTDSKEIYANLWSTISAKKMWEGEVQNRRKDGSLFWVHLTIIPELDDKGNIISYISYHEDITHAKLLQEEKQNVEYALNFRTQFLSNMSHEIRTPLNAIIGLSEFLQKSKLDDKQSEITDKIVSSSHILLSIVNDILDISKIESGKMPIEKYPFNLHQLIDEVVDIVNFKAQEKGVELKVEFLDFDGNYFLGDALRINQVLINLLNNAIKFTSEGSVILQISSHDNMIVIKVIDSGIGMSASAIEHLFEEFVQADMSTTRKYGGTGLGLAISRKLVELMHGSISVESEVDVGSTFTIELPLEATSEGEEESDEEVDFELLETEVNSLENIHILVAEDNKMNQHVLEMLLEDSKLSLDFSDDGSIAVDKLKSNSYDLVLMDIQMPNMNGYEATQNIREFNKEIPIIGLSANVMKTDVDKALEIGMNDYLAKPIELKEVYRVLLKYLNHKEQ